MSHPSGPSAKLFKDVPRESPTRTTASDWLVRSASNDPARVTFRAQKTTDAIIDLTKSARGPALAPGINSSTTPAAIAGMTIPAGLAKDPYQGISPRSSRRSVVPRAATQPPTAGPPRKIAASIGAVATPCWVPNGNLTGSAQQTSVRTIQNATPAAMDS